MADFSSRLDEAGRSSKEPTLRLGRLPSPSRQSPLSSLLSNLKDFLTERPVKVLHGMSSSFTMPGFGDSLLSNLAEFFRATPRGGARSPLLINWKQGFGSPWENLRDLFFPRKLPPLKVSSQPIPVPEIWTKDTQFTRVQALSVAAHVLVLVLIILPFLPGVMTPATTKANNTYDINVISPYLPKMPATAKRAQGGGGGEHNPLPASRGRAPKFDWTQLAKPEVKTPPNPKYPMTPVLLGNPAMVLPSPQLPNWGDPLGKTMNDSNGQGRGTGIGSGTGGGLGQGEGGGTGGGAFNAGTGGYGYPTCLYCPEPQFSDEAVKAKYQGVVLLSAIITADGRATDIQVVKGLGLGLDEKAIEAVRTWRFTPARGPDGKAAAVRTPIEVTFRLY